MKIIGTYEQRVVVDIAPTDIFLSFVDHLSTRLFPEEEFRPSLSYDRSLCINSDGNWELWVDERHGSGSTAILRKATEEEVKSMETYLAVLDLRKMFV